MECIKFIALLVWLSTALSYTKGTTPGGSVLVKLYNLHNPDNTNYAGSCCGKGSLASNCDPCDYQLSIWVTCDGKTSDSDCLYGVGKTRIFYNKSVISFPQDLGNGSRNPLVYNFTSFQGNLGISILATNQHGSKIHSYRRHESIYPTSSSKKKWTNETLRANGKPNSNITLSYQVHCKEHYYGPSCSVGCVPGANYICDESTGRKLCINSYIGPNCTCKTGSHKYNCDATGKRHCYPPWYGVKCDVECSKRNDGSSGYNCDTKTGAKICLAGWYGPECNETRASTTILPKNSLETISTTPMKSNTLNLLTTKNSTHYITSMSRKMMSSPKSTFTPLMTLSLQSSSLMTSPLTAISFITLSLVTSSSMTQSPITSLMTSSTMTPSTMTSPTTTSSIMASSSITSHLFPSHAFSSHTVDGTTRQKRSSMTVRNFTRQTESFKLIATTSYLTKLKPPSSYIDEMTENKLSRTSVDFTAISVGGERTKETVNEHKNFSSTCCDVTSTPTPRATTFRPGSTDARKGNDLWWLMLLPFIFAILLIGTGIAAFKKKNRKRRKISPHYEASMQEFKVKSEYNNNETAHDQHEDNETAHEQQYSTNQNNNESGQEDLEAIWKVMTTFHE